MNIIGILEGLLNTQMFPYIFITRIIASPMHKYPYGNNIEIRFKLSNNFYSNDFYCFHCKGTKFSLKFVDSSKSTLLCKGEFTLDAFFTNSVKGNEAIPNTPINLLNIFFHSFNMTLENNKNNNRYYYVHKTVDIKVFDN